MACCQFINQRNAPADEEEGHAGGEGKEEAAERLEGQAHRQHAEPPHALRG
jgi:hypothetical protein